MKTVQWFDGMFKARKKKVEDEHILSLEGILFKKTPDYLIIYDMVEGWLKWRYSGYFQTLAVAHLESYLYISVYADEPVELRKYDKIYVPPVVKIHEELLLDDIDTRILCEYVSLLFDDPVVLHLTELLET